VEQQFYLPDLHIGSNALSESEAHHVSHVLRLREGDTITVIDGAGHYAHAQLVKVGKKECICVVNEMQTASYSMRKLHLYVAPTKNADRYEWMLEKATELNIASITPIICKRSERKNINSERLSKIIVSASKQSKRYYFPVLNEALQLAHLNQLKGRAAVAHCYMNLKRVSIYSLVDKHNEMSIFIGPEGDFTEDEVHFLQKNFNAEGIHLGNFRLRTETAALAACSVFQLCSND
jgi:16S rRNA (uracil1498-N3)-methyltransferase